MKQQVFIFAGLIGVGVAAGATLVSISQPDQPESRSTTDNLHTGKIKTETATQSPLISESTASLSNVTDTLAELQRQLQQEISQRQKIETRVALLEKQLENNDSSAKGTSGDTQAENNQAANPHQTGSPGQGFSGRNFDWFNEQAMLDAGIDPVKVNYIKDAFEQAEMDRLYLRNQATREGWIDSKRYTDSAKEIADRTKELRNELSENEYDAYLFAAGRANRVLVSSVLSTSPASNAGIQAGDTILRYNNKRIYSWSDLTSATSEGTPDETVVVTIERDGQTQQVYLPRGPLGVRLATDSVAP